MAGQNCWHIFNNITRQQIPDINKENLENLLVAWQDDDFEHWFAWQQGWSEWRPITEVPEIMSLRKPVVATPPPPPPPPMIPPPFPPSPKSIKSHAQDEQGKQQIPPMATEPIKSSEQAKSAETESTLGNMLVNSIQITESKEQQQSPVEKRRFKRYNVRLRVILTNGQSTFRTFTKNISLGGVFLEHPVPHNIINTRCEIYIASLDNKNHIKFETTVVANTPDGPRHFSFSSLDTLFLDELHQWLNALETKQRNEAA